MSSITELKQQARNMLQDNRLFDARSVLYKIREAEEPDWECWYMLSTVHGMLGEYAGAESCARQVIVLAPDVPGGHVNLGNALVGLGRLEEAEECFQSALELDPAQPQTHLNFGNLLKEREKPAEAEAAYRKAIALQPDYADAYGNLAILLQEQGRLDEALACYRHAQRLMPSNMNYLYNLACGLHMKGDLGEAEKALRTVLDYQPHHADAILRIGVILESQGRQYEAIDYYKSALSLKPDYVTARRRLTMLYSSIIPGWHFPMMNDEQRNSAYDMALRKVVKPDSIVLDIGSGSGLLAMMAARAGAKHVYTCEVVKPLAEKAREIVATNGYSGAVTIINKKSTDLVPGEDIPGPVDILVSEILDEGLLGEGVIPSVHHARSVLVRKEASVIPRSATVHAVLVESESLYKSYCVNKAAGFDVDAFNEFSRARYTRLRLSTFTHRILGRPFDTFSFDLADPDPRDTGEEVFTTTVDEDCTCHAIVFWFRLDLDAEISVEISPSNEESCWMQAAQIQHPPLQLRAGQEIRIHGRYDSTAIRFSVET
jgi:tetratricopeptide (TPR) repeat protein